MRFCWSHAFHYRATTLVALSKWKVGDWSHWFPGLPWYIYIYIANFLKTNLTKFVVIWVKRRQRLVFSSPRSSKVTVTKEKERREKKKRREGKEGKKKAMPALPVFIKKTVSRKWSIWRYMNHVTVCPSVHIVRRPLFTCKPGWHFAFKRPRVLVIAWPTGLLVWIRLQSCVYIHWRG